MDVIWLVPLVPAAAATASGLAGIRLFSRTASALVGCGSMAATCVLSVFALLRLIALAPAARAIDAPLALWIPALPLATTRGMGTFEVAWALRLDPLAAVMILVVTGVGFLIHVYAAAYMQDEPRGAYARFFCYLNLFCAFMLLLSLGANFLVMFVGWEGVGLCSYLLIGFWYEKRSAAVAGFKAFLVNRIGDWAFVVGILLVFFTFGTLDFRGVARGASAMPVESGGAGVLSIISLLLFAGAVGKSAQLPLHVWLPDAMEGPTPVSALIHAATMVTAGVYMVARNATLFSHAPVVMTTMAAVGVVTALLAAAVAMTQTDIKRVLAYSTISQLGLMFLAAGTGAFAAAVFHLMTHAFFKALLFLSVGAVIHAMAGEQDLRRMGGLRRVMPVTALSMGVGTLAIAGIPPLSGFFSKDEILYRAFLSNRVLWGVATAVSLLTAFYMVRLMVLAFAGGYRGAAWSRQASPAAAAEAAAHGVLHPRDAHAHGEAQRDDHEVTHGAADALAPARRWDGPHEAPGMMRAPVLALALGSLLVGLLGVPAALGGTNALERFLTPSLALAGAASAIEPLGIGAADDLSRPRSRSQEILLTLFSLAVATAGILAARHVYLVRPDSAWRIAQRWPRTHALLANSFYVDRLYAVITVRGTWAAARSLLALDLRGVDAVVDGAGAATRISAWISHMLDKHLVDGVVRAVAGAAAFGGALLRRGQTGLLQNYALTMVAGVFVLLTAYLITGR
jgi:NADH-quinone oxidoreductase subunit L